MTLLFLWTTVSPFCSHGLWELQDPPQWGATALGPHHVSCLLQLLGSHWLFQEGPPHFSSHPNCAAAIGYSRRVPTTFLLSIPEIKAVLTDFGS